jgi:hypothetical protein
MRRKNGEGRKVEKGEDRKAREGRWGMVDVVG